MHNRFVILQLLNLLDVILFVSYRWSKLLRPEKGDPTPDLFVPRDDFTFIVVTGKDEELPKEALTWMTAIRVGKSEQQQADGDKDAQVDQELAGLFGAAEVKRISLAMVEAAFDGCAVTDNPYVFSTWRDVVRLLRFDLLWSISRGVLLIGWHSERPRPNTIVFVRPSPKDGAQCLTPRRPPPRFC